MERGVGGGGGKMSVTSASGLSVYNVQLRVSDVR